MRAIKMGLGTTSGLYDTIDNAADCVSQPRRCPDQLVAQSLTLLKCFVFQFGAIIFMRGRSFLRRCYRRRSLAE